MIWAYIIVISIWLGYEFIRFFAPQKWDQLNLLSGGVPLGFTFVTWIFFFIRYFHHLNQTIGVIISFLLTIICYLAHQINPRKFTFRRVSKEFYVVFALLMILFFAFADKSFLKDGRISCGTIFSDLPFHLSLITTFSYGPNNVNTKMITPFYYGEKLCYPIVPDFFSAILVSCGGASLRVSIAVPTVLLMASMIFSMHYLFRQYSSYRYVSELGIVIFVLASGTGWRYIFSKECFNNVNSNLAHSFCYNKETFWIQSVAHYLYPQRSGAFSITLCLLLMSLFIILIEGTFQETKFYNKKTILLLNDKKPLILAGVMMGVLPMISAHAFISVGIYALSICCLTFPWKDFKQWHKYIFSWGIFGVIAIIIALPQIIWLLSGHRQQFFSIEPIWTETEKRKLGIFGYFTMWWDSLGTFHFLAVINVWFFMKKKHFYIYIPAMMVYLISTFVRYQPGAMDNTKVFLSTWYPIACVSVSLYLLQLAVFAKKHRYLILSLIIIIFISFSISSIVCFYKNLANQFPMFEVSELSIGLWVMENTYSNSSFISDGWHACPPMSIGGRVITMGYLGWVWTHGLDYGERRNWEINLVQNKENYDLFKGLNIMYAISKKDDQNYNMFPDPGNYSHWTMVVDIGSAKIYRILKI